jgi:iron(III) transport system ATP-binding protein
MTVTLPPPTQAKTEVLTLSGLTKRYHASAQPALSSCSLSVGEGELVSILGPSGCGKTTLLRLIAGFERPDAGSIRIGRLEVAGGRWVPPEARGIGFVFQDYALFPHLTVMQNVAFGLPRLGRKARRARTHEVLDLVGLTIFAARYPHQLSGGQQQRVALARALAPEPAVMLLDEPFSNLDAALRGSTRKEVRRLLKLAGVTTILVTHDQEEAMTFAERLVLLRAGELEQQGSPEEVYRRPRTAFAASFLGTTNLLRGDACGRLAQTPLGAVRLTRPAQGSVLLSLRPEDVAFAAAGLPGRIVGREFKGHDLTYSCEVEAEPGKPTRVTVQTDPGCPHGLGDTVFLIPRGEAVPLEGPA